MGKTLGSFTVTALIGEGGMGQVYLAEHGVIGRKAAIKVLSGGAGPDVVARFFTEARAVNDIRHPNIVEVTDFGSFEGQPYIVMEFLEGETLADRIERTGEIEQAAAARIAGQIASAVGAAHERGMVHRDLKPANIFLRQHPDYPDFVKVLDFGITKLLRGEGGGSQRTQVGAVLGTPEYMSPEQCLGDANLDHRSDIYSLGVVLYAMVTGRPPFSGDTLGRLILSHVSEAPPPPVAVNARVSSAMNALILRALAKKPEDRFASMKELREALAHLGAAPITVTATVAVSAPARPPASRPPTGPTLGGATTVGQGALGAQETLRARVTDLLRGKLGGIELPALSPASVRALEILREPSFSFRDLSAVLAREPRLSSHVLQRARGGTGGNATSLNVDSAVARLGAHHLRCAVIDVAARPLFEPKLPRVAEAFRRGWAHARAVALIADWLAGQRAPAGLQPGDAYLAGLLADAGKPLVAGLLLDIETQMADVRGRRWMTEPLWLACIDATHAGVAAAIARRWGLGEATATAIEEAASERAAGEWTAGLLVRLAGALAAREGLHFRREEIDRAPAIVDGARRIHRCDEAALARAVQAMKTRVQQD